MTEASCSIEGCERPSKSRGWCKPHYERWRKARWAETGRRCSIDGCEKPTAARGWCSAHYERWKKHGDPLVLVRRPNIGPCAVDGCDEPMRHRDWCGRHYQMWRRTGDPTTAPSYTVAAKGGACVVCDSADLMKGSRRYCSPRCAQLHYRGTGSTKTVPCVRCGRDIDLFAVGRNRNGGPGSGRKRRADSKMCADCARQRKYRHGWSAHALAERDGIDCGICGEPVDMDLRWPDFMCPSVDHVISRADGGTDDPTNLQLAHLACNHRKSKRSGWTAEPSG